MLNVGDRCPDCAGFGLVRAPTRERFYVRCERCAHLIEPQRRLNARSAAAIVRGIRENWGVVRSDDGSDDY